MTNTMVTTNCPATDHAAAIAGEPHPRSYRCHDYDSGQCACRSCAPSAWAARDREVDVRNAVTAEHRAHVAAITGALACLALVGRAVVAALAPGRAVAIMITDLAELLESTHGDLRGAYFRVAGKRGNAKQHHGKVGIARWVGEGADFAPQPRYRSGWYSASKSPTIRVGLAVEGEAKLVYVAHGQLERVRTPAEVHAARVEAALVKSEVAPLRARLEVQFTKRGKPNANQVAYIVEGRDAGKSGVVFWCGTDKKSGEAHARLGIKTADGETVWVSAYECSATPAALVSREERDLVERIAADAAIEGDLDAARAIYAQRRRAI